MIPNPNFVLKPQMFADAALRVEYGQPLLVPQQQGEPQGSELSVQSIHESAVK